MRCESAAISTILFRSLELEFGSLRFKGLNHYGTSAPVPGSWVIFTFEVVRSVQIRAAMDDGWAKGLGRERPARRGPVAPDPIETSDSHIPGSPLRET